MIPSALPRWSSAAASLSPPHPLPPSPFRPPSLPSSLPHSLTHSLTHSLILGGCVHHRSR
eukprot:2083861-Rhodomonas_salina.1